MTHKAHHDPASPLAPRTLLHLFLGERIKNGWGLVILVAAAVPDLLSLANSDPER